MAADLESLAPSPPSAEMVELGRALASRAGETTAKCAHAAASAGLSELASRRVAKRIRHVHNVATRGVANQLMTGRGTTEKERHFIGKLGVAAALRGASLATLVRSYLMWRDVNLAVLEEEVIRLVTPPPVAEEAYAMVRASADMGMVRLARAYDSHLHLVGHREDSTALALRDVVTQLELAAAAESGKNTELSTALAEISEKNHQLLGVNRQQSNFISNISHELRTPLAGILGHTELLLGGVSGELGPEQRADVQAVDAGGQVLLALVNNILDETQIEARTMTLHNGRVDLKAAIESEVARARPSADAKHLYVRADTLPAAIALGDEVRLKQVVSNLIDNAIKFTQTGGVTVNCLPWAGFWRVSVGDTGIGLREADEEKVFDRFMQADAGTTRRFGGAGLGLAIARGLVVMLGGDIGVDSVLGEGSTFWFTVPAFDRRSKRSGVSIHP
ncbi:MAG TPA: HAMP domain-containing sensor histidine kinase [Candidatus Dormibacteraeota bacterium]|nr:HAMP domain-containing sensor histidine kinase [Candidatus Dormibacteraeota bacterium]